MRNRKTNKYKYKLTEEKLEWIEYITYWLNVVSHIGNGYDDPFWGSSYNYRKRIYYPVYNWNDRNGEETQESIIYENWLKSLSDEYLQYKTRFGEICKKTYQRRMNKILKEVFHDGKRFYDDEERITINYHREMYLNLKGCPWWDQVREITDEGWKKRKERKEKERELEEQEQLLESTEN